MDPTVQVHVLSTSVGVGMIVSALTQILKLTESIPGLRKVKWVQSIVDAVTSGNVFQIRCFVAIVCVAVNAVSLYLTQGTAFDIMTMYTSFLSFWTALGTYDLVFSNEKKPA